MKIKAVLFDMDGVLIDAREWHYNALNKALAEFGFVISRESHLTTFDGIPTREKLNILSKTSSLPYGLHELICQLKQQYTLIFSEQYCRPKFNHVKALKELKREYKLAVCSNSVQATIQRMLSLADIKNYFDEILSNEDVEKCKPDPEMYLKAMERLKVSPEECLIIEDNENGLKAAIASGGHVMRVNDPSGVTIERIKEYITITEQR